MNFQRQMQRASQRQEIDLVQHTVQVLSAENSNLVMENKSLFRAMGAMVLASGGEIRIPRDIDAALKGKHLVSDVDGDDIVFNVVDATAVMEQDAEQAAEDIIEEILKEAATNE